MNCSICHTDQDDGTAKCSACGAPLGGSAVSGQAAHCSLCGEALWSMAETCVHCGARGYPALRPRMGDRSLKAPGRTEPS